MKKESFIFYGAGKYAQKNLDVWLTKDLIPVCFADADKSKHCKKIRPQVPAKYAFDVLPFGKALELYPDADIYVTINAEIAPELYRDVCNYIVSQGVLPERVSTVPEISTGKQCIFYGAGQYASINLRRWVSNGIVPVCFVDSNEQKHYTKMCMPPINMEYEFEILPVHEALERYPEAFLYITTNPKSYDEVYDYLIAEGVPAERIGAPSQHCQLIGHRFVINDRSFRICDTGYSDVLSTTGNIKDDVEKYYAYCEQLRKDLNKGKLTTCTGCNYLHLGRSDERLKITRINLESGLPGGEKCCFRCCYCAHGMNYTRKLREQCNNVLEIMQFFRNTEDIEFVQYSAAEISISPYKREILKLMEEKKYKGRINTNAFCYVEELKNLLSEKNLFINVSIDSGTPETFAKIKSVDGFKRVVENLEKYASANGKIELKYIVLDGINCGKADLDGFISIAKKINAHVIISCDHTTPHLPMSDIQHKAILYLVKQCISLNMPYSFLLNKKDIDRLKKEGVHPWQMI